MTVEALVARYGVTASTTRPVKSQDAGGAPVMTYSANLATVTLLIQRSQPGQAVVDGARRTSTGTTAYAVYGTDILPRDRVTVGSETWEVIGVRVPDERTAGDSLAYSIIAMMLVTGEP